MLDKSKIKYVVRPTFLISPNGLGRKFIHASELIRKYKVNSKECVVVHDEDVGEASVKYQAAIWLYPDWTEEYVLPVE